jgi:hypothetical protein
MPVLFPKSIANFGRQVAEIDPYVAPGRASKIPTTNAMIFFGKRRVYAIWVTDLDIVPVYFCGFWVDLLRRRLSDR